jgi:serine/threonine-protein kinase
VRRIGQGTNGKVYLAESPAGISVALKLVTLPAGSASTAAGEAFLRSAATAQRLVHPGIVALYTFGLEAGLAWLAMEPVPGADLSRYTAAARLLPEPVVLKICGRVAQALAYAHRQGVVHRDVKPANILVDWPSDAVKLADFGLARADDGVQTGTGIVPGSPAFMAPELLAGALPTPRSDLYALGATLYQLLTGQLPHDGASMGELLRHVAEDPVPDPSSLRPELPPELAELVTRLLAKQAAERPVDADVIARQLASISNRWQAPL